MVAERVTDAGRCDAGGSADLAGAPKDARSWTAYYFRQSSGVDGQDNLLVYLPKICLLEPAPNTDQRPELARRLVSFRARGTAPVGG